MNAVITMTATNTAAAVPFSAVLIDKFVAFIDRSNKTAQTYLTNLRQFAAWLRFSSVTSPQREDVLQYRSWLLIEHDAIELSDTAAGWTYRTDKQGHQLRVTCKPNTVKQYLQSVKQFFAWTAAEGLYPNIAANIHAPKVTDAHRKDSLTAEDVRTVEASLHTVISQKAATAAAAVKDTAGRVQRTTEQGARIYAMYLLAVNAGLRTIEISRANVCDLECRNGQAWLRVWGKGHTEADTRKALAPEVYAAIRQYLDVRTDRASGNAPLFVSTGNRSGGKRIAASTVSKMLKQALQAAGYDSDRITAHSLRHTAGQNIMQVTGDNIYKAQQYMRHASPKTTEIYLDNNAAAEDAQLAVRLYAHYHNNDSNNAQERLQQIAATLTADKLEQLTQIAAAML